LSDCESIFAVYPRRVAKRAALKSIHGAIERLIKGEYEGNPVTSEEAIAGLKNRVIMFAQSAAGKKDKFTPYPATWFNASRYLDDPTEWEDNGNGQPQGQFNSASAARSQRSKQNILDGILANASRRDALVQS
jgi:hypothetical protein